MLSFLIYTKIVHTVNSNYLYLKQVCNLLTSQFENYAMSILIVLKKNYDLRTKALS